MTNTHFNLQPTLRGTRLEARPLLESDFDTLFTAASDPLIWEQHPEPTRYTREVFRKFFDGALASGGAFAVIEMKSGRMIGSSRYYEYKPELREVKVGYTFLEREFWGHGFNRELKALLVDYAFQFVDRVLFEVGECNIRSQKAMENIGAKFLKRTEVAGLDGNVIAVVMFQIER